MNSDKKQKISKPPKEKKKEDTLFIRLTALGAY